MWLPMQARPGRDTSAEKICTSYNSSKLCGEIEQKGTPEA